MAWQERAAGSGAVQDAYITEEVEEEAEWIEPGLTDILNSHTTCLRVIACSKR